MGADAHILAHTHNDAQAARRAGFSRVLLAYDGGISARQGLTWVPQVASSAPGTRAVVIHVQDPRAKPKSALARQLGVEDLDELVRALATAGVDARPLVVAGDPAREIPRAVIQLHADLLVCGSRGRGPFGRKVMGSVADSLVKQADANLLLARTGGPPAHVLLATDGSLESVHACRLGAQLADRWNAAVTLLGVYDTETPLPRELAADILPRDHDPERYACLSRVGDPATQIVAAAAETKAGLIVMGRRGAGKRDALAGTVAARVAKEAPASVLLMRRPPQA